jgi:hypothetical protein
MSTENGANGRRRTKSDSQRRQKNKKKSTSELKKPNEKREKNRPSKRQRSSRRTCANAWRNWASCCLINYCLPSLLAGEALSFQVLPYFSV